MNKFTQKLLIALAFSMLLLGSTNASFAAKCKYRVHNHSGHTVKVILRYADNYQQTNSKEIFKLGNKRQIILDKMRIKSTVTIVQPNHGYVRFTLLLVQAPGCFQWVETKRKNDDYFYRYFTATKDPKKGQMTIYCKKEQIGILDGKCGGV